MLAGFGQWRGRAARFALTVIVHILGFALAFYLSPPLPVKKRPDEIKNFRLLSLVEKEAEPRPMERTRARQRSAAAPPPPESELDATPLPLNIMIVSSEVFRAADISRFRDREHPAPAAELAEADGDLSIGRGPGGERLYAAQWYREPTDAEMQTYLPRTGVRSGHALIICRTVTGYRVEDCRELEEAPPFSGLARAMRLASWQFRVRPPQIGGKPMVGAWVQIRFDLIEGFQK